MFGNKFSRVEKSLIILLCRPKMLQSGSYGQENECLLTFYVDILKVGLNIAFE